MAKMTKPQETHLKDYEPSNYLFENVFLHFDLHPDYTIVKSILKIYRNPESKGDNSLCLNGEELQLRTILLEGTTLHPDQYEVTADKLIIPQVPDQFTLEIEVLIKPAENKALSGLYQSKGNYCTQCEAQGFRRITYFLDRPDVLTRFTTTITADKTRYPVLLSNGNLVDSKELEGNRQWVMWEDPSLKPCYLFALVAGDYEWLEDTFDTLSGRTVLLRVYVEKGNLSQSDYAMGSLKRAMRWDEETYGREYDLDIYMIVAVSDFNMGAMENKGLNIFNDRYILAKPDTATDDDYINIESVIGHEYFHNWSGNRVTVSNWFQITLKEGLTIFRDQNFTADMTSHAVKRIKDVNVIRNFQFPQDAGPMAHPIRPDSYIEINNFYTVTVYNKGAEVIRMMETLLGKETFRKAMDIYFATNDGKAVTTENFVQAMEQASDLDLTQFRRWYTQAGTPQVEATGNYDEKTKTFTLHLKQFTPPTPDQAQKEDYLIPIRMALLSPEGEELALHLEGDDSKEGEKVKVISLTKAEQKFVFNNITQKPLPSLLRNFSAPVKLHYPYTDEELIFLMSHDTDGFNSWDAGQQLAAKLIIKLVNKYQPDQELQIGDEFTEAFSTILNNSKLDKLLMAEMLSFPAETYLLELMDSADITAIYCVRKNLRKHLATQLKKDFLRLYHENNISQFSLDKEAMGQRRIKNLSLSYLMLLEEKEILAMAMKQFHTSNNLTDTIGALSALTNIDSKEREEAFNEFYDQWQKEPLVVDKWFSLQAISTLPHTFETVKALMSHSSFDLKNPNKTRALIGAFTNYNHLRFHDKSGEPYAFLADLVMSIDSFNPQLAARLIEPLIRWRKYDKDRQALMREELTRISNVPKLSNDVYEIVTKSLV
ncbi:MAG: aminopeptidase N [Gammaproteobacteria bacterium]|nr:aminopeptidase N [Gammaproteobacteria bacterium]